MMIVLELERKQTKKDNENHGSAIIVQNKIVGTSSNVYHSHYQSLTPYSYIRNRSHKIENKQSKGEIGANRWTGTRQEKSKRERGMMIVRSETETNKKG